MSLERVAPQQKRSRETVERILDAADELFGIQGYHGTPMTQVIQHSGVKAGSLYRFFPDKMSIAEALIERHSSGIEAFGELLQPVETLDELLELADILVQVASDHRFANPGYRAVADLFNAAEPGSPLYEMRHAQVKAIAEASTKVVAGRVTLSEHLRVIGYMAEIIDALLKAESLDQDRQKRVNEIKRVVRGYVIEVLSGPDQ